MTRENSNISLNSKLTIFFVIIVIIIIGLILSFDIIEVSGESMVPTLQDGESVLIWSLPYYKGLPGENLNYGDIVVVSASESMDEILMIKRVIGLENDIIDIENGLVYRNGEALYENYAKGMTLPLNLQKEEENMPKWDKEYSYTVPEKHVYLLGDNRLFSSDSREYDALPLENIIGRMIYH